MNCIVTNDEIRSDFVVRAPRSKVWWALTTEEGWTGWFSDAVDGKFAIGETIVMEFTGYGKGEAKIVELDPERRLAFRWHPGDEERDGDSPDSEMTLVAFELGDHAEGTMVTMVESGFNAIPEGRRKRCLDGNTEGWNWELDQMVAWLEQGIRQYRPEPAASAD